MAFRPGVEIKPVDLTRLHSQLQTSQLNQKDQPLFQVIDSLIQQTRFLTNFLASINTGGSSTTNITEIINQYMIMQGGNEGEDGIPGPPGTIGIDGAAGATGAAGPITLGPMGLNGEDGDDGMAIPGPIGATGINPINILRTTANQTINAGAGTYVDITSLTFPVINGQRYAFKFYIVFQAAATTTGWKASVNCPAGTLDFLIKTQTIANSSTAGVATWLERHSVTRDDMTTLTTTITAGVDLVVTIEGRYLCTADGTFAARFANELAANTDIVVQDGSWGFYF